MLAVQMTNPPKPPALIQDEEPTPYMLKLGERIRLARTRLKWSQKKLSDVTKITQSTLSGIENGEHGIKPEQIEAIGKALGVTAASLLPSEPDTGGPEPVSERASTVRVPEVEGYLAKHPHLTELTIAKIRQEGRFLQQSAPGLLTDEHLDRVVKSFLEGLEAAAQRNGGGGAGGGNHQKNS